MTLPASGSISTDQILAELRIASPGRNYPLSTLDADVLALAGKSGPPLRMPDDFWGKSVALVVTSTNARGSAYTGSAAGTVSCSPSVTVQNGSAPTYQWSFTSNPGAASLTNTNAAACTVSKAYARNSFGELTAELQCVVTDGGRSTTKTGIVASLDWSN